MCFNTQNLPLVAALDQRDFAVHARATQLQLSCATEARTARCHPLSERYGLTPMFFTLVFAVFLRDFASAYKIGQYTAEL